MITHLGEYPSLAIGPLLNTHRTDIGTILRESLESEGQALAIYKELLITVEGKSVMLEEYAMRVKSTRCFASQAPLPHFALKLDNLCKDLPSHATMSPRLG
jgi:hypothetical protein